MNKPTVSGEQIAEIQKHQAEAEQRYFAWMPANSKPPNERVRTLLTALTEARARIGELEAALKSIAEQTDDCAADETYYGGVWREVNATANAALTTQDNHGQSK